ncbi:MAG: AAA family ATPase [Muribaculaceae bacterium]|nr:AAA family ATPase [Muribaculaceae bacterium]
MKILKIELLNLASLDRQEGEIINFEEGALRDATIFSIVGATGSGKSTILDAICLALYNRAPRYPRKKGERNQSIEIYGEPEEGEKNRLPPTDARNILTRGKKEGYSKLTFRSNNGAIFRAEWRVARKSKNYGAVETSLYKLITEEGKVKEEVAEWDTIPQIIGLDYDQFLRTVLIAQGSFSSFIRAKENERYELLEKLIGCEELYTRIAAKIKQQKDEAVKQYSEIAAHFSAFEKDIIPEEEHKALIEIIKELETKEKEVKEGLLKTQKALEWYITNDKYLKNITGYTDDLKAKKKVLDDSKVENYQLELHDTTLAGVTIYKDWKTAETDILKEEEKLKSLKEKFIKIETQQTAEEEALEKLKVKSKEAESKLQQQMPHIRKAREIKTELDGLRKVLKEKESSKKTAESSKNNADINVENNKKDIEKYKISLEKCQKEFNELNEKFKNEEEKINKNVEIAKVNFDNEKKKTVGLDIELLQKERNKAEKKLNDLKSAIKIQSDINLKINKKEEILKSQKELAEENNKINEKLKELDIENLSQELDILTKSYTLITSENWNLHRKSLQEGKPCPLCGALNHPYTLDENIAPVVDNFKSLILKKKEDLNNQRARKDDLSKQQSVNNGKLDGIKDMLTTLEAEIESLSKGWDELHSSNTDWPSDKERLMEMQPEMEKEFNEVDKKLTYYNNLTKIIEQLREKKETAEIQKQEFDKNASQKRQAAEKKIHEAKTLLETEKGKSENLLAQQKEKANALELALEAFNNTKVEVENKEKSLKNEIGDKDPEIFEKELEDDRNKANKEMSNKIEEISRLREELKEIKGEENAVKGQREKSVNNASEKKKELQVWIKEFNEGKAEQITEETIAFFYESKNDWEGLRGRLNNYQREYTAAETTLKNETKAYNAHQDSKPEKSREELTKTKTELENHSNAELIDGKARIQRHEMAKEKMGEMFVKKEEAERYKIEWEEITGAIGAEGKTLRKIAQCHTLGFLIRHANFEIRKFNNRYELQQVKNSLGIRIIDHDRADDIRDTTSLSGGETFLVSLGLALGLSSLSSRNISFENLFIDEGFGTLDPETLDTVIDSLSMLQTSQGKKVGVISHTDSISERIATQIRVIKHGNSGSSHIEIYP